MKRAIIPLIAPGFLLVAGCGGSASTEIPASPPASAAAPAGVTQPTEQLPAPKTLSIIQAASLGNAGDVKAWLQHDPSCLNRPNEVGFAPLHFAAMHGHVEVARVLLAAGADVNVRHANVEATPLQYAAAENHLDVARILIENGADVRAKDRSGRTPLDWAESKGHLQMVEFLRAQDPSAPADQVAAAPPVAKAAPHPAASPQPPKTDAAPPSAVAARETTRPETPSISLLAAIQRKDPELVRLAVQNGADLNAADALGKTALIITSHAGDLEMVQVLLEAGADPSIKDAEGWTAIMYAASFDRPAVVEALVAGGADPNSKYPNGAALLDVAMAGNRLDVVKALLKRPAGDRPGQAEPVTTARLIAAVESGNVELVKSLVDRVENINAQDEQGRTALMFAVVHGHAAIVKLILEKGADAKVKTPSGWTSLHVAIDRGHQEIAQMLIDQGADVSAQLDNGYTPLDLNRAMKLRPKRQSP